MGMGKPTPPQCAAAHRRRRCRLAMWYWVPIRQTEAQPMQDEHHIRQRAYEIWEREGRPEGRASVHWQEAEREVEDE